jgi:uncharacterized RDD family membrane protein YckC
MHSQHDVDFSRTVGARCALHSERPAHDVCVRCGTYVCAEECHRLGDNGLDYCIACVLRVEVLAERGDRFIANLVDQFVVVLPFSIGLFLQLILMKDQERFAPETALLLLLGALVSLGVMGYQLHLVAESGQTIGKRMRNIRMVRGDGSPVTLSRVIFLRNVVPGLVNSACSAFGLIDALFIFNNDRRCLHDVIADTKVVQVNPDDPFRGTRRQP